MAFGDVHAPVCGASPVQTGDARAGARGGRRDSARADRRTHGAAGQPAVVVQPPQQQPLLLAGGHGTRRGTPAAPESCMVRCTAVSYVRISRVRTSIRLTRKASRAAGPAAWASWLICRRATGASPEHRPQRRQVVAGQIPARVLPVDEHRDRRGQQHVGQQRVAVAELAHAAAGPPSARRRAAASAGPRCPGRSAAPARGSGRSGPRSRPGRRTGPPAAATC